MKLLDVVGLTKIYGKRMVLNSLDLDVNSGEIVGLLGHNGAGKSTAFNSIIGITSPDGGRILFKGKDITKLPIYKRARLGLGYLCQEPSVFQRLTVEENILAILEARRLNRTERRRRTDQLLAHFGLGYLAKKKAYTLSGGEKRRLEVARCLATDPALIMLDEPFSGIDPIVVGEAKEKGRGAFNVVDKDYPTQREFIKTYKKLSKERFITIYVPMWIILSSFWLIERMVSIFFKKSVFLRYKVRSINKNVIHNTERLEKKLGWVQKISFEEGIKLVINHNVEKN